jgi:hypothetical protein
LIKLKLIYNLTTTRLKALSVKKKEETVTKKAHAVQFFFTPGTFNFCLKRSECAKETTLQGFKLSSSNLRERLNSVLFFHAKRSKNFTAPCE